MHNSIIASVTGKLQQGLKTAAAHGAKAAKIGLFHEESVGCGFEAGRLKDIGVQEKMGYEIEVLVNDKKGLTTGNRLEDLDKMIDKAITLAKVGSTAHFDAWPKAAPVTAVNTHSDKTSAWGREAMVEACGQIVDRLKAFNPELFIGASAERGEVESVLVTTGGVCHTSRHTDWHAGAFVVRTEGTDILETYYGRSWCDLNEFLDTELIAGRVIDDIRNAEKTVDPPKGKTTVFFPPEVFGTIVRPIFMGINGRNVAKGDSPLAGKLNQKVLSPVFTIIDNPHVPFSPGASEMDADGVPTRRETLFEAGVLKMFLYDLDSAGLAGATPTGHDDCSPHWPMVTPGTVPSEKLLAGIEDGIFIRGLLGFGQGNIINGDFSCNVGLGYRIRKGKIVGRIKDTMISGNLYELLSGNVALSSDLNYSGLYPSAVVEGVSASAK